MSGAVDDRTRNAAKPRSSAISSPVFGTHLGLASSGFQTKTPLERGFSKRMMGLEPTTFCMASRRSSQLSYIRGSAQYSPGSLELADRLVNEALDAAGR